MNELKSGVLFLLVGNSGSGKDTLLKWAMTHWPKDIPPLYVPRRIITRPPSPDTEDYISASPEEFKDREGQGEFVLRWRSYDIDYGVPKNITEYLEKGLSVIVNVSRQIIEDTRKKISNVKVIFIQVPLSILSDRLKKRGREGDSGIERRLLRAELNENQPEADFIVENSGTVEEGGKQLLNALVQGIRGT
ncbi:MAG: phosphonate ABC transporter ATP-binding protein [Promethearchaeota archaeon CR_4]|nr:MAG: phosphonate ABC transporter ATP-binding protein [Candidatus Lokiarchaeota archaeon CR_4]